MPKFIGRTIPGSRHLDESGSAAVVRISYAQAKLLPPEEVFFELDETDRGGPRTFAKRWYRWYAKASTILRSAQATDLMKSRATRVSPLMRRRRRTRTKHRVKGRHR